MTLSPKPVTQSGVVTPRHLASWTTDGVIEDSDVAVTDLPNSMVVTDGTVICENTGTLTIVGATVECGGGNTTITIPPILPSVNKVRMQKEWAYGAIVADGTGFFWNMPYDGVINTLQYFTGNDSFDATIAINGATVTGLGTIAVASPTPGTATASALNTFAAGDDIGVVVSSTSGSPTNTLLSLDVTWTS